MRFDTAWEQAVRDVPDEAWREGLWARRPWKARFFLGYEASETLIRMAPDAACVLADRGACTQDVLWFCGPTIDRLKDEGSGRAVRRREVGRMNAMAHRFPIRGA